MMGGMKDGANKLSFGLPKEMRLKGRVLFDAVYKQGKRRTAHPLSVHVVRREDNGAARLGISIGTRCGNAVRRNLIKRRLREAFRLMQHEVAVGCDFLVVVKPHVALEVGGYRERFGQLMR